MRVVLDLQLKVRMPMAPVFVLEDVQVAVFPAHRRAHDLVEAVETDVLRNAEAAPDDRSGRVLECDLDGQDAGRGRAQAEPLGHAATAHACQLDRIVLDGQHAEIGGELEHAPHVAFAGTALPRDVDLGRMRKPVARRVRLPRDFARALDRHASAAPEEIAEHRLDGVSGVERDDRVAQFVAKLRQRIENADDELERAFEQLAGLLYGYESPAHDANEANAFANSSTRLSR